MYIDVCREHLKVVRNWFHKHLLCVLNVTPRMASRGRHVDGSDGSDHMFRNTVKGEYKAAAAHKASLSRVLVMLLAYHSGIALLTALDYAVRKSHGLWARRQGLAPCARARACVCVCTSVLESRHHVRVPRRIMDRNKHGLGAIRVTHTQRF